MVLLRLENGDDLESYNVAQRGKVMDVKVMNVGDGWEGFNGRK